MMHSVAAVTMAAKGRGKFKKASSPVYAEPNLYDSIAPLLFETAETKEVKKPVLAPPEVPRKNEAKSPELPPKLPEMPPKKIGSKDSLDRRSSASSEVEKSPDLSKVRFASDSSADAGNVKDKEYFDRYCRGVNFQWKCRFPRFTAKMLTHEICADSLRKLRNWLCFIRLHLRQAVIIF